MTTIDMDLCIPLYITAKTFRNEHARRLKKLGLTFTQFIVMSVLWERHSLLVKEIGRRLDLDSGTLTPVLKKLEEKGYVTRRQSQEDARDLVVTVTEEGEGLRTRVDEAHRRMAEEKPIDRKKVEKVRTLLTELVSELKEIVDNETNQ